MGQIMNVARFEEKPRLAAFISRLLRRDYIVSYNLELDASIRWRMHNRLFLAFVAAREYRSKKVLRRIWLSLFLQVVH